MSLQKLSRQLATAGVKHVIVAARGFDPEAVRLAWYAQSKMPKSVQKKFETLTGKAAASLRHGTPGWTSSVKELKAIFDKYPLNDMVYNAEQGELEGMSWNELEDFARRTAKEYADAEYPDGKKSDDEDEVEAYENLLSSEYDNTIDQYRSVDSSALLSSLIPDADTRHAVI